MITKKKGINYMPFFLYAVPSHAHQLKNLELTKKIMSFLLQVITKFSFFG